MLNPKELSIKSFYLKQHTPYIGEDLLCTTLQTINNIRAGLLIAPLFSVHSDMGTLFGLKAFAVAILGGMTSASGVMIAGFMYGITEAMVTAYIGSSSTFIVVFALIILALTLKPDGLFGQAAVQKV